MTSLRKSIIWYPDNIFIDKFVLSHPVTKQIISRSKGASVYFYEPKQGEPDDELIRRVLPGAINYSILDLSQIARKSLILYDNNEICEQMSAGKVEERRCYNFLEFIPYSGVCRGMCGYCWFNEPILIPKVNVQFFDRLPLFLENLSKSTSSPVVFTFTHHRTDCFAIEHLTDFVRTAAKFFENREQFFIQYLTKSDNVECLLEDVPSRGSIVCFSVNSPIVSDKVELCTSSVDQRLIAAQKLANSGIPVLLRIDPMLAVDNWRESYKELVELIFGRIRPKQITLGTPRFQSMDELTSVVKSNKNNNVRLIMEEQAVQMTISKPGIPIPDGDLRLNYYFSNMPVSYPKDLRIELYKNVVEACRKYDSELSIGLCEEPLEIWEACDLKWTGKKSGDCTCNFVPKALA